MELFDTRSYGEPLLTRFEGGQFELSRPEITKSFRKAKKMVLEELNEQLRELQAHIAQVEAMQCAADVPLVDNPYC